MSGPGRARGGIEPLDNARLSALRIATPPGTRPEKISALASAMASTESKNSRCTGATVVMIATCGRAMRRQRRNFARMVHADFDDAEARLARHPRQGQRHAPMIVVGSDGGMRRAGLRKHMPQSLFRRRLADRAGDGDDPRRRARARRDGKPFQRLQDIMDDVKRPGALQRIGMIFIDHRRRRAFGESIARHDRVRRCARP